MDSHECVAASLVCKTCGSEKPLDQFYFVAKQNLYFKRCKACVLAASKARYEAKRTEILARQNARAKAKKADIAEYARKWYQMNRERVLAEQAGYRSDPQVAERERERQARYYAKRAEAIQAKRKSAMTPERIAARRAWAQEWAKANRVQLVVKSRSRRLRIKGAMPPWADIEAIRQFYREAARLTEVTGVPHEVDHIVPIQGRNVSGLHVQWNLRVVTRYENRSKSNKLNG
jgi:5-methylcytosine-specific restriction endonuclease McrA